MATFEAGKTYRTRSGCEAGIDKIRETDGALMGWIHFDQGRTSACWFPDGSMTNGRVKNDPNDLIAPIEKAVTAIEDVTPDRLSVVESSLRDVHRQLRVIRGNQSELMAGMAAKLEQLGDRLDAGDRRMEVVMRKAEQVESDGDDRMTRHDQLINGALRACELIRADIGKMAPFRPKSVDDRISTVESTLARIEDLLTAEREFGLLDRVRKLESWSYEHQKFINHMTYRGMIDLNTGKPTPDPGMEKAQSVPARKSLGWINFYKADHRSNPFIYYSPTREEADANAINSRRACVEIFEGDGL